jgi:hypothetical protein
MHLWQGRSEHNYLENELLFLSIVICYTDFHYSLKATSTLVLECYSNDWMNFHYSDQLYLVLYLLL